MKRVLKVLGVLALVFGALAVGALTWLSVHQPASRPASTERIEATPIRLARGKYLVEHVTACLSCHSDHVRAYGFPVKPGTEGQGGYVLDKNV